MRTTNYILRRTEAARLTCHAYSENRNLGRFQINCTNDGKSWARELKGSIVAMVKPFPDGTPKVTGPRKQFAGTEESDLPPFAPHGGNWFIPIGEVFTAFPGLDLTDIDEYQKIVEVDGTLAFDNGVGMVVKKPLCFKLANATLSGVPPDQWIECGRMNDVVAEYAKHQPSPTATPSPIPSAVPTK